MSDLHMRYMGLPGPTDVLAFPATDVVSDPVDPTSLRHELTLWEIVVCPTFIESNTQSDQTQMNIDACLIHGMAHLLGYDHQNDADAARMALLEDELRLDWAEFKR